MGDHWRGAQGRGRWGSERPPVYMHQSRWGQEKPLLGVQTFFYEMPLSRAQDGQGEDTGGLMTTRPCLFFQVQ